MGGIDSSHTITLSHFHTFTPQFVGGIGCSSAALESALDDLGYTLFYSNRSTVVHLKKPGSDEAYSVSIRPEEGEEEEEAGGAGGMGAALAWIKGATNY